ncbi:MAG: TrkA family potassium uptake protein [Bowdeniella nasicola]|nr:TrkA family potassium uptake protein [Bowdeniella nasicola]
MHFVIMGCGRVGAMIATQLDDNGHSVAVIDGTADAFRRVSADFSGQRVTGLGFDRDVLEQAGIEDAYAFAAVSSDDNSNIIAARVAREVFAVPHVVARIYDPKRAEAFQRLGITTVATVRWTADQVLRCMLPTGGTTDFLDTSGRIALASMSMPDAWIGQPLDQLVDQEQVRVAFLTRLGKGIIPDETTVIQEQDVLHFIAAKDDVAHVERAILRGPEGEEA